MERTLSLLSSTASNNNNQNQFDNLIELTTSRLPSQQQQQQPQPQKLIYQKEQVLFVSENNNNMTTTTTTTIDNNNIETLSIRTNNDDNNNKKNSIGDNQNELSTFLLKLKNVNYFDLVREMIAKYWLELIIVFVIIAYLIFYFTKISRRPKLIGNKKSKFVNFIRKNLKKTLKTRFNPLIYFWGTNPQTCLFGYLQGNLSIDEMPRNKFRRQYLYVSDAQYLTSNVDLSQHYLSKQKNKFSNKIMKNCNNNNNNLVEEEEEEKRNHKNNLVQLQVLDLEHLREESTKSCLNKNIRLALNDMIILKAAENNNKIVEKLTNDKSSCSQQVTNSNSSASSTSNSNNNNNNNNINSSNSGSSSSSSRRPQTLKDLDMGSSSGSSSDSGVFNGHSSASSSSSSSSTSSLSDDNVVININNNLISSEEMIDSSSQISRADTLNDVDDDILTKSSCSCKSRYSSLNSYYFDDDDDNDNQQLLLKNRISKQNNLAQDEEEEEQEEEEFGQCALDWFKDSHKHYHKNKLVALISAGMTSGSDKKYVTDTVKNLVDLGYEVCVFIRRGVGGLKLNSKKFFSPAKWRDFEAAIKSVRLQRPNAIGLVAIGFSFGSIELCRYLSMSGKKSLVDAALLISCPFDPEAGGRNMRKRLLNRKIDAYLAKNLGKQLYQAMQGCVDEVNGNGIGIGNGNENQTKQLAFNNLNGSFVDLAKLPKIKSLVDFEDNYNRIIQNYPNSEAYADDSRLSEHLKFIKTPTLCLSSEDDFMAPLKLLPLNEIELNENLCMILTKRGGHMAFIDGLIWPKKPYFAQRIIGTYMESVKEKLIFAKREQQQQQLQLQQIKLLSSELKLKNSSLEKTSPSSVVVIPADSINRFNYNNKSEKNLFNHHHQLLLDKKNQPHKQQQQQQHQSQSQKNHRKVNRSHHHHHNHHHRHQHHLHSSNNNNNINKNNNNNIGYHSNDSIV